MNEEIGEVAGDIYRFLENNGRSSKTEISRNMDATRSKVNMAIGWLAREDKVKFKKQGRGTYVSLKEGF